MRIHSTFVRLFRECPQEPGAWCEPQAGYTANNCTCQHSHLSYDTFNNHECNYWTADSVYSASGSHTGNTALNTHYHYHHSECTQVWP
jgi:hypothetical protein